MIMLLSLELSSKLFPPGLKTLRGCFCFRVRKSYEYFIPISLKCDHGAKGCHVPTLHPTPLPSSHSAQTNLPDMICIPNRPPCTSAVAASLVLRRRVELPSPSEIRQTKDAQQIHKSLFCKSLPLIDFPTFGT